MLPTHHSAEHILTAVFGQLFNAKIIDSRFKGTKVRCDYEITSAEFKDTPLEQIIAKAEKRANEIIAENREVTFEEVSREQAEAQCSLHRLPDKPSLNSAKQLPSPLAGTTERAQKIRLVKIGPGVVTPCVGEHVKNTSEIGMLKIRTFDWVRQGVIRLSFGV